MEPEKKSNGALVGLVIIVVILVIGAIYLWYNWELNKNSLPAEPVATNTSGAVTSDDSAKLDQLEADVQSADTSTGVDVNTLK